MSNPPTLTLLAGLPEKGTLVFLPDVGGNVLYAQHLVSVLSRNFACYGAKLSPDMAARLHELSVESICSDFARDIVNAELVRPVHLVGFSFAALFAAETARNMSMIGTAPQRLWILDMPVPRVGPKKMAKYLVQKIGHLLSGKKHSNYLHRPGFLRLDMSKHPEAYHNLLRSLYYILTAFKPRQWVGNATVVISERRKNGRKGPDDLGWAEIINGDLTTCITPGDHLGMLYDPDHASALAEIMIAQSVSEEPSNKSG